MDDADRIDTFKQFLRVKYRVGSAAPDIIGLRALVDSLGNGEAADSVVVTAQGFDGLQSSGQLVLEPMAKLRAALDVLAEAAPSDTPAERPNFAFIRFGAAAPSA